MTEVDALIKEPPPPWSFEISTNFTGNFGKLQHSYYSAAQPAQYTIMSLHIQKITCLLRFRRCPSPSCRTTLLTWAILSLGMPRPCLQTDIQVPKVLMCSWVDPEYLSPVTDLKVPHHKCPWPGRPFPKYPRL